MHLSDIPVGKGGFCWDGYGYYKYFLGPGRRMHYRCGQYKKTKCKVKLVTTFEGKVLEIKNKHNHKKVLLRKQRRSKEDVVIDNLTGGGQATNGTSTLRLVDGQSMKVGPSHPIMTTLYSNSLPYVLRPFMVKDETLALLENSSIKVDRNGTPPVIESPAADSLSTTQDPAEQQIQFASEVFSNTSPISDEFVITAKKIAYQLRAMAPKQLIIAEKLIADAMFYGQLGLLKANSNLSTE